MNNPVCLYCGEEIDIVVLDEEGNIKGLLGSDSANDYIANPWSGLSFSPAHKNEDCPIANWGWEEYGILGSKDYDTVEDLIAAFVVEQGRR